MTKRGRQKYNLLHHRYFRLLSRRCLKSQEHFSFYKIVKFFKQKFHFSTRSQIISLKVNQNFNRNKNNRLWCVNVELKGTVSQDFCRRFFSIKQFLLVPIDILRNNFEFSRIFVELFVFIIESPVYSSPESWDSVMNTPGSRDFPAYYHREVGQNWLTVRFREN